MDARNIYLQNRIIHARRICISIGKHIDGHFNWALYCHILPIRINFTAVRNNFLQNPWRFPSIYYKRQIHNFPLSRQYRTAVALIWLVALSINLPWLFVFRVEPLEHGSNRKVWTNKSPTHWQCLEKKKKPLLSNNFQNYLVVFFPDPHSQFVCWLRSISIVWNRFASNYGHRHSPSMYISLLPTWCCVI